MKKVLLIAPLVLALSACGSFKYKTGVEVESGGKRMFSNEVNYPDWYAEGKDSKDGGLYAVGSEYSKDFQFSVDKAMLSAKRELASNFSSYISAMMKDFATESGLVGNDVAKADVDRTTKLVVGRVNLVGVERTHFKVVHENTGYRTFVRVRYDEAQANRILANEIKRNQALYARFKASKSFNELEAEVQQIDAQKTEQIKELVGEQ